MQEALTCRRFEKGDSSPCVFVFASTIPPLHFVQHLPLHKGGCLPLRMTFLCDAFVFFFSAAPRQRATAIHRKSDVLKSHRYSQDCHSEIADKIRSRRFYLKNLLSRTACKFRLWQRRNFFCNLSFLPPKLAKGSEKEILRLVFSSSFSIPAAQNDNFVRCVCFFFFGGTKAPPYGQASPRGEAPDFVG